MNGKVRKIIRTTLVANPNPGGDVNVLKEDLFKLAQCLWHHISQCSHAMLPFDQLAYILHNPH